MEFTLYAHDFSTPCTKVRLILEELNLPYQYKRVALEKGEQYKSPYLQINRFAKVPAITHGDFKLAESNAICRYLVEKTRRFDLYPVNLEDRALVDQWWEYTSWHISEPLANLTWFLKHAAKISWPIDEVAIERDTKKLKYKLPILEQRLSESKFLCGPTETIADLCFVPFLALHEHARIDLNKYPFLKNYLEYFKKKPSWNKVIAPTL